nr:nucleotide-binding alpha-beta plait domain-containing protein [Tanacetum cinerariifolium]
IPVKRTKVGKRFGFVRFINVFSEERLVNNLCTIWVDCFKLHANIARFQRPPMNKDKPFETKNNPPNRGAFQDPRNVVRKEGSINSYVNVMKSKILTGSGDDAPSPSIVIDDDFLNPKDVSNALLGRVKEFESLSNLKNAFSNEGFAKMNVRYMGELWVLLEFATSESKDLFKKNVGMGSWFSELKQAYVDFIPEGRIVCDVEVVPDTSFDESNGSKQNMSEDPFNIYPLLNWKDQVDLGTKCENLKTGNLDADHTGNDEVSAFGGSNADSVRSGRFKKSTAPRSGGSFLGLMEEVVKVGQMMEYNMEGCENNLSEIIKSQGVSTVYR